MIDLDGFSKHRDRGLKTVDFEKESHDRFLTPGEVAVRLQVTRAWVYRHARKLGAYRMGKYIRFLWPKLIEAIEQHNFCEEPNDHAEQQD